MIMGNILDSKNKIDRRKSGDRRKRTPVLFNKYLISGRRTLPRRQEDRLVVQYVDRYNSKILGMILVTLGLSLLDAIFTLLLVDSGAREVNPLMAYYLDLSPSLFLLIKYLLTCSAVILILFCKDRYIFNTKIKARVIFFLLPIPFFLVIPWQLILIFSGP